MGLRQRPRDAAFVNFFWDKREWLFINLNGARDSLAGARAMVRHHTHKLKMAQGLVALLETEIARAEGVRAEREAEAAVGRAKVSAVRRETKERLS